MYSGFHVFNLFVFRYVEWIQKSQIRTKMTKLTTAWFLQFKSLKFDVAVTAIWPWVTENQSTDWISNPLSFRRKKNEQRQQLVQFGSSRPDQTTVRHLGSNFFVTVKKRPYTTMQHIEQF